MISTSPNGWVPSMYCNGLPLARSTHKFFKLGNRFFVLDIHFDGAFDSNGTCSCSQRNSLRADGKSRHERSSNGSNGFSLQAWRSKEELNLGIQRYEPVLVPESKSSATLLKKQ